MKLINYIFDDEPIKDKVQQSKDNLLKNKGETDLEGYAVGVISRRLKSNFMRYRDYGMYWPALKEVMRKHGYDYGEPYLPELAAVYCGADDLQTVVMSDEFRNYYLENFIIGSHEYTLDPDSFDMVSIIDTDIEIMHMNRLD